MDLITLGDSRADLYENPLATTSCATPSLLSGFGHYFTNIPGGNFRPLGLSYLWAEESPNYLWATEPIIKKRTEKYILETFAQKMLLSMKDADPDFLKIADDFFEDILL